MVRLETQRLIVRDHIKEDLESMHGLLSHETAMYYLPDIKTRSLRESMDNLNEAISQNDLPEREKYFFRVELRDGTYVGEIGFTVVLNTPEGKVVNLGYFILPDHWGRGYVTEAAREVIRYAFEKAGAVKVETGCIPDNKGSESVMKKLAMIQEAHYKKHVWHDGKLKDRVEYRLLKEEREAMQTG